MVVDCIDFSIKGCLIFNCKCLFVEKMMKCIVKGVFKYVLNNLVLYIVFDLILVCDGSGNVYEKCDIIVLFLVKLCGDSNG